MGADEVPGASFDGSPLTADAVRAALARAVPGGVGRVEVVARTGSTSTDLMAAASAASAASADTADTQPWPDRSVLATDHQTAGRGRAGRAWETPAGEALTFSVLLRPQVQADRLGWLPLLAGLAVVRALEDLGVEAGLKWPNDVLVVGVGDPLPGWGPHRKVAGVLGDLGAGAAVLGIGVNVHQRTLPVPSATSLAACGVPAVRADLLAGIVAELVALDERWRAADGDACAVELAAECAAVCLTLGARVRVSLPGGDVLAGDAVGLSDHGGLRVVDDVGRQHVVLAGDVEHVRA